MVPMPPIIIPGAPSRPSRCPHCNELEDIKRVCRHCNHEYADDAPSVAAILGIIALVGIGFALFFQICAFAADFLGSQMTLSEAVQEWAFWYLELFRRLR